MNNQQVLSSEWIGLSPFLIAQFVAVIKDENGIWKQDNKSEIVAAPLTEASLEVSLNWQSPFEQSGAESKFPSFMALLQSGQLEQIAKSFMAELGSSEPSSNTKFLEQFEGRTGITRLNSTQVFSGMPPIKITVSALFRAWKNPKLEVESPFDKLMEWSLPSFPDRSSDMPFIARLATTQKNIEGFLDALLPSKAPQKIAMTYKNRTYCPLVIESISMPLNSAINKKGEYVELLVPLSLASLSAIDKTDWNMTRTYKL